MSLHRMMPGACSFLVFHTSKVHGYMRTNVRPSVRMCIHTYVLKYVCDPVKLRLRHLYQVEFCSFIVRYPTAGASVYCGHISSFFSKFCDTVLFIYTTSVYPKTWFYGSLCFDTESGIMFTGL